MESSLHSVGHPVGALYLVINYCDGTCADNKIFEICIVYGPENVQTFSFNFLRIYISHPATICLHSSYSSGRMSCHSRLLMIMFPVLLFV